MPATTLDELYDFESQFDFALKAVLDPAIAATHTPSTPLDTAHTPFITAEFNLRGPAGPTGTALLRGATSDIYPETYSGEFVINLITNRQVSGAPNALRGKLRQIMLPKAQAFNSTVLPWLEMLSLEETASNREIDTELDTDRTAMTYTVIFGIRPDAWPV